MLSRREGCLFRIGRHTWFRKWFIRSCLNFNHRGACLYVEVATNISRWHGEYFFRDASIQSSNRSNADLTNIFPKHTFVKLQGKWLAYLCVDAHPGPWMQVTICVIGSRQQLRGFMNREEHVFCHQPRTNTSRPKANTYFDAFVGRCSHTSLM